MNTWLKSHPREVVLLDCSHFEGIADDLHEAFIQSLKKLFGSKLVPRVSESWLMFGGNQLMIVLFLYEM